MTPRPEGRLIQETDPWGWIHLSDEDSNLDSEQEGVALGEFGNYRLLKELGRGAQGVVYLAEEPRLRRRLAIKVLTTASAQTAGAQERFHREAELASKLVHPGICAVHEYGVAKGQAFIAMQYVPGSTLAEMIEEAKLGTVSKVDSRQSLAGATGAGFVSRKGLSNLLQIFEKLARALHAAHEVGLIHRDIKPANIMVAKDGSPVILDFGLARDTLDSGQTLTQSGQAMGTPAYMAWEQILGKRDKIDRRTDIYALGVTLYECLTLRRPYEAEAVDQLYNLIIQGAPANPCKRVNRLPKDLGTVVEVAMDRECARRYPTALEMAEDLRRVRSFEPIRAKAANSLTRTAKWMRRNPAPSVGLGALALFVLFLVGFAIKQGVDRREEIQAQIAVAEEALAAEDTTRAREALTRLRDRDPDSARAEELSRDLTTLGERLEREAREQEARSAASRARAEAAALQHAHEAKRAEINRLEEALENERPLVFAGHAELDDRVDFARREANLRGTKVEAERILQQAREALERAMRLEEPWGGSDQNRAAFADYYFKRWTEAISSKDSDRAALYRSAIERFDPDDVYRERLLGYGALTVVTNVAEAELHLYRYEPYEKFRPNTDVPRLVPVPTQGIGNVGLGEWTVEFAPGEPCLVIESVEEDSPAGEAGLSTGDLVLEVQGERAAESLFASVDSAGGVPRRILSLNNYRVRDELDWAAADMLATGELDQLQLSGFDGLVPCNGEDIQTWTATELLEGGCTEELLRVDCLRNGLPHYFEVNGEEGSGLTCRPTRYPLIRSAANRIPGNREIELEPGSYLVVARLEGYADLRLPVFIPRLETVALAADLERVGTIPPGFIRVPAGPFRFAGDSRAKEPGPRVEPFVEEFFVARYELTNAEWFEFLDDPEIAARVSQSGGRRFNPRESGRPMPRENLGDLDTPVMGISWEDLEQYLAWRNARADEDGEPWIYDMPTELEWEKAARGVDGRAFPWGDRFDYAATVGLHSRAQPLFAARTGIELRDESPYGALDFAGHRREWTSDWMELSSDAPRLYRARGGSWRFAREQDFRCASRQYAAPDFTSATMGARLVARRRP